MCAYGMQSPGLRDAGGDDGDLSFDSYRDDQITDYECDLPVPWAVCGSLSGMQVPTRADAGSCGAAQPLV